MIHLELIGPTQCIEGETAEKERKEERYIGERERERECVSEREELISIMINTQQWIGLKNVFAVGEENLSHRPHSLYLGKFHQHSISIFANKRCQFHQHFTRKYFVQKCFAQFLFSYKAKK